MRRGGEEDSFETVCGGIAAILVLIVVACILIMVRGGKVF